MSPEGHARHARNMGGKAKGELLPGEVYRLHDGSIVMLDRRVPGDGTAWYVADWSNGWAYYDNKIEPSDIDARAAAPANEAA